MHSADGDHSSVPPDALARLFKSSRMNAVIAWVLVGMLGLVVVESVLDVDRLWILFTTLTAAIVLIPPMAYREWRMMLPWELLSVALLPIWVRALFGGELGTFGYYLSVAGLALIVTVELHMFTSVRRYSLVRGAVGRVDDTGLGCGVVSRPVEFGPAVRYPVSDRAGNHTGRRQRRPDG